MFNFSLSVGLRALWYSGQKSTHTLASLGPARLPGSEGSTRPPRGEGPRAGRVMSGSPAPPKAGQLMCLLLWRRCCRRVPGEDESVCRHRDADGRAGARARASGQPPDRRGGGADPASPGRKLRHEAASWASAPSVQGRQGTRLPPPPPSAPRPPGERGLRGGRAPTCGHGRFCRWLWTVAAVSGRPVPPQGLPHAFCRPRRPWTCLVGSRPWTQPPLCRARGPGRCTS